MVSSPYRMGGQAEWSQNRRKDIFGLATVLAMLRFGQQGGRN